MKSLAGIGLAEIGAGMHGVDPCCCTGAGIRFPVRFRRFLARRR